MAADFEITLDVLKTDPKLGLVFGWGMICSKGGKPYGDLDAERITIEEMLKSATEFGEASVRPTDEMHDEEPDGVLIHSFPLTDEIAKVFGITCDTEGWMVAVKPSAATFAKYEDGTYTGFSIGGTVEGWEPDPEQEVAA